MDNRLLAKGMLLGMSSLGIEIDKWEDQNLIYISVPKDTAEREGLAGKKLADRLQTKIREMGCENFKVKYRLRDEVWSKEKADKILSHS
jgi:hypothetical protein